MSLLRYHISNSVLSEWMRMCAILKKFQILEFLAIVNVSYPIDVWHPTIQMHGGKWSEGVNASFILCHTYTIYKLYIVCIIANRTIHNYLKNLFSITKRSEYLNIYSNPLFSIQSFYYYSDFNILNTKYTHISIFRNHLIHHFSKQQESKNYNNNNNKKLLDFLINCNPKPFTFTSGLMYSMKDLLNSQYQVAHAKGFIVTILAAKSS